MSASPISILKKHKLRVTDCRIDILKHFIEKKGAFSQSDLENQFKKYDRVTIYRTLNSFLKSKILHKIPNQSAKITYALRHYAISPRRNFDYHIHFRCNRCETVECLDHKTMPEVSVPTGYEVEKVNLIAEGVCAACT